MNPRGRSATGSGADHELSDQGRPMNDVELLRTAWHEAGHQAAAYWFGRALYATTIRPTPFALGRAHAGRGAFPEPPGGYGGLYGVPFIMWPAVHRRTLETFVVTLLAGEVTELRMPIEVSEATTEIPDHVLELSTLTKREAAVVDSWQAASEPGPTTGRRRGST